MKPTPIQRAYDARRKSVVMLHKRGWSAIRIAAKWRITRQRVYQILREADV